MTTDKVNLLTTADLAERYEVAESTARAWCARGRFPNAIEGPRTGSGRVWLVPEADLEGWEPPKPGRRPAPSAGEQPAEGSEEG